MSVSVTFLPISDYNMSITLESQYFTQQISLLYITIYKVLSLVSQDKNDHS